MIHDMAGVCTGCKHSIIHPFKHTKYGVNKHQNRLDYMITLDSNKALHNDHSGSDSIYSVLSVNLISPSLPYMAMRIHAHSLSFGPKTAGIKEYLLFI